MPGAWSRFASRWATSRSDSGSSQARLSRHWLFLCLLAAGAVVRFVTWTAYWPVLEFYQDSYSYLYNSQTLLPDVIRPLAYPVVLRVLSVTGQLATIPLVQHVLMLAVAAIVYAALVRLGVPRLLAALSTVPALFDAYQLFVEEMVMAEALATFFLVVGLALLVWWRRPPLAAVCMAGLALGLAPLARTVTMPVIAPALVYAVFRLGALRTTALAAAFAVPIGAYATWFHAVHGTFGIEAYDGYFLADRVALLARCDRPDFPAEYRRLCSPLTAPRGLDWYLWDRPGPLEQLRPWQVPDRNAYARGFALYVIRHSPRSYARTTAEMLMHYYGPGRYSKPPYDHQVESYWFRDSMPPIVNTPLKPPADWYEAPWTGRPSKGPEKNDVVPAVYGFQGQWLNGTVDPSKGHFLREYQRVAYTPGPLLGVCTLLGILGLLAVVARRVDETGRERAFAGALFAVSGLGMLLLACLTSSFDYRFLFPVIPILPAAGALGLSVLWPLVHRAVDRQSHAVRVKPAAEG